MSSGAVHCCADADVQGDTLAGSYQWRIERFNRVVKCRACAKIRRMPHPETWLKVLPQGLYCEPGGFFIDPLRAVDRAVVTHAHSDHARPGHRAVLATADTLALMTARLGEGRAGETRQALGWGETLQVGDVRLWLQPAGHVL